MRTTSIYLLVAGIAGATAGGGCERTKYTPTECTVWTETNGSVTGTVYMQGGKASLTAGGARSDIAYLGGAGHIHVVAEQKTIDAATFDGKTIRITYLEDARFASQGFDNGTLVIASDIYRTEFYYNSLCTASDVAVGAVTLFTTIFPPGKPVPL